MRKMTNNLLIFFIVITLFSSCTQKITIVTPDDATNIETFAAAELKNYLSEMYPEYKFQESSSPGKNKTIYLEVTDSLAEVPENNEGYLVISDDNKAFILSRGETGLVYGVYGILEKLGCGFYLSDEFVPEPQKEFDFEEWDYANEPLIKDRFVFNWHNFISGCTGWDIEQWKEWIDRSQKMGYNTVMVHTYHNNPMHTFEFNGIEKEVGYICTSARGRDWGNIPINDVRRLPGGEIFENAEFGSEIAMVTDSMRVRVAQESMEEVFAYATGRGVKVNFAFDIDMPLMFLKETMIESIQEDDKFYLPGPGVWVPRPDKPEGYRFYKSQIEGLLSTYKTLTGITFFRRGSSFFRDAKPEDLPVEWQNEYTSYLNQFPYLKKLEEPEVIGSYITARLVLAYQEILKEMDKEDIDLGTGSWQHHFVVPTAAFLPDDIKLMPIDWNSRFDKSIMDDEDILDDFASRNCSERVIPFIWAHHDDGKYLGRPFRPTENLYSKLTKGDCNSFGVFHWMNRPLDLFLKNMVMQVWSNTKNESLDNTCKLMAQHYFGTQEMAVYFREWMSNAPMFGRATLMNFFYRRMDDGVFDFEKAITECKKRIAILDGADVSLMNEKQSEYLEYHKTLEQFIIDFSETQPHLLNAEKYLNEGQIEEAQKELQLGDPAKCIKTFSKLSQLAKHERGEMAFTYRLATKYIPDYVSFEQRTRLKPFYITIDSVVYEDLAQGNYSNLTYHVDTEGNFWECLGQKEFESQIIKLPEETGYSDDVSSFEEIFQYGIKINSSDTIPIRPVMRASAVKNKSDIREGLYELKILVASEDDEEVTFSTDVSGEMNTFKIRGKSIVSTTIEQTETGLLSLVIRPESGNIIICGVILKPI